MEVGDRFRANLLGAYAADVIQQRIVDLEEPRRTAQLHPLH